jgi:hypothetical protein
MCQDPKVAEKMIQRFPEIRRMRRKSTHKGDEDKFD